MTLGPLFTVSLCHVCTSCTLRYQFQCCSPWTLPFITTDIGTDDIFMLALSSPMFYGRQHLECPCILDRIFTLPKHNDTGKDDSFQYTLAIIAVPVTMISLVNAAALAIMYDELTGHQHLKFFPCLRGASETLVGEHVGAVLAAPGISTKGR